MQGERIFGNPSSHRSHRPIGPGQRSVRKVLRGVVRAEVMIFKTPQLGYSGSGEFLAPRSTMARACVGE